MANEELPDSLAERPKDRRGLPIPVVTVTKEDGTPDFTAIDGFKSLECGQKHKCGLCGRSIGRKIAFLGGQNSFGSRAYVDPPMHPACAEAATRLCPHIAKRELQRSKKLGDTITPTGFQQGKPDAWILAVTGSYQMTITEDGGVVFLPGPWTYHRLFEYDADGNLNETKA